jgi:hypothetical protein
VPPKRNQPNSASDQKRFYDLALIANDSTAFSYQSSDLKAVCRLTVLRLAVFVLSIGELGFLRSNFGDALRFTPEK